MKMIRNKNEMVPTPSLLVIFIGLVFVGAMLRSRNAGGAALWEWIAQRLGTPLRTTIQVRELTQLAGFAHRWLRDVASATVRCALLRPRAALKVVRKGSR